MRNDVGGDRISRIKINTDAVRVPNAADYKGLLEVEFLLRFGRTSNFFHLLTDPPREGA